MRSKMNWLYVFACLTIAVGVASATTVSSAVINDPGEPGSVLVFPKYRVGVATNTDSGTAPLSAFEVSVVCPNGAVCQPGGPDTSLASTSGDVDIHFHWVCDDFAPQCEETDFTLETTVNGTIRFDPNGNCLPKLDTSTNGFETCGGIIPPPPCDDGYLIGWVVDEFGNPIKYDGLLGDAVLRQDGQYSAVTAYNAIAIQAGKALPTYASTDLYHNGHLNFNGIAYKSLSNTIIGSVRFDGTDPDTGISSITELVLLTLDTKSNLPNNPVEVRFNVYNEIEQGGSFNTAFWCTEEVYLSDIGVTAARMQGQKGLLTGTASKTPTFGFSDKSGPVTLLGLVITHEDDFTREYAYPLLDNSIPLATAFAP